MFQIWMKYESGAAALVEDPSAKTVQDFMEAGLHLERTLRSTNGADAQREFAAWARVRARADKYLESTLVAV